MRLQFWLAQATVSRRLHLLLRLAAVAVLVWGAAAGAGFWTVRAALAHERGHLSARQGEWRAMDAVARRKEREASLQPTNGLSGPPIGSGDFVNAVSRLARSSGAPLVSAHLDESAHAAQANTQTAAQSSIQAATPPRAPGMPFECTVTGPFPSVAGFLDLLARQSLPLQIGSLEASCVNALPGAPHPPLLLKLTGTVADQPAVSPDAIGPTATR